MSLPQGLVLLDAELKGSSIERLVVKWSALFADRSLEDRLDSRWESIRPECRSGDYKYLWEGRGGANLGWRLMLYFQLIGLEVRLDCSDDREN